MISSDAGMTDENLPEMKEELSEGDSDPESLYDDPDLGLRDDVSSQLIAAGPVGLAAAAAIATGRRRKRGYMFETNPAIRRRQQTRLMRRLRATIDEYCVRVGQQAIVVCCAPGAAKESFRVFGAKPLEDVIKNIRQLVLQDLEIALARQAPNSTHDDSDLFELPPLVIEGIPTPIDKMSQQQLRMFIPHMLKYSTGRGKPGWGREDLKPIWWPDDVPWKNIRIDERPESVKATVSWTHALRQIVKNCYFHHGREDLLPTFDESLEGHLPTPMEPIQGNLPTPGDPRFSIDRPTETVSSFQPGSVQTLRYPDGSLDLIQIDSADSPVMVSDEGQDQNVDSCPASTASTIASNVASNTQILNVSSIQQIADTNSAVITLHDGSVHHITTDGRAVEQSCPDSGDGRFLNSDVDQEYGVEATIDADGHIVVTGDVSALTNADVGVYNMMLPGPRGQVVTLVDGEVLEVEPLLKTKRTLNNSRDRPCSRSSIVRRAFSIDSTEELKENAGGILQIEVDDSSTFRPIKRRKTLTHLPPDPGRSFSTGHDAPGEIMIENADSTYSVIPTDKIQLIQSDHNSDPSLHEGGFHVIEIAPGVQQLGLMNNNNNSNNNNNNTHVEGETVINARHALINLRRGEDTGGGGGEGELLGSCGVEEGVEVSSESFFGDGGT